MELELETIIKLLERIAVDSEDGVAENVLVVARLAVGDVRRELVVAVADGLGVPLV